MIGSTGIGDFFGGVWDGIKKDVSDAANTATTNVRRDLANAANQLGAGVTSAASGALAPAGNRPVTIPLTANQLTAVTVALVVIVGVVLYLAFRRR